MCHALNHLIIERLSLNYIRLISTNHLYRLLGVVVTKTVKVSDQNYQTLEAIRKDMLKTKMETQIGNGKLERTDVTFDEVISKLLQKEKEAAQK
jgi:hypothetical protein